jgi:hypothetical protein
MGLKIPGYFRFRHLSYTTVKQLYNFVKKIYGAQYSGRWR